MPKNQSDIEIPLSTVEKIERHQRLAEDLLDRASKPGRLEADTRLAVLASAHASLAISYQLQADADIAALAHLLPAPLSMNDHEHPS
jgi:hypothetical protein